MYPTVGEVFYYFWSFSNLPVFFLGALIGDALQTLQHDACVTRCLGVYVNCALPCLMGFGCLLVGSWWRVVYTFLWSIVIFGLCVAPSSSRCLLSTSFLLAGSKYVLSIYLLHLPIVVWLKPYLDISGAQILMYFAVVIVVGVCALELLQCFAAALRRVCMHSQVASQELF